MLWLYINTLNLIRTSQYIQICYVLVYFFFVSQLNYWQMFCARYSLLLMYIINLSNILYSVYFTFILFIQFSIVILYMHSHKKQKNTLKSSLVRVLFAAEIDFPKILVLRLPQNTSNVNIESIYLENSLELWYIFILLSWYWSVFNWLCLV